MNKKLIFRVVLILSLAFNAAAVLHFIRTPSTAAPPAQTQKTPLNLTTQQKQKMEPVRRKLHKQNTEIKKQITTCQQKLLTALNKDPVDKPEVTQCIETISDLQKQLQLNTIEEIIQMKKHMNPTQCTCMINNLDNAINKTNKPCTCPHCNKE